ncbi:MAG TPA: protoporphyrinogen oxidase, partial [Pyrinomonadaceae bacterium]|nr:protoporphyrinogen oxidase [Pyrinomonadaceae bacterium]
MKDLERDRPLRIAVVGGGISGLAAAHRLQERSLETGRFIELTLLEAGAHTGGTVRTYRRDRFLLEGGPDSFISEKPEAVRLAERMGISDRLIETNPLYRRSFIVRAGRLHAVPEGFQLLAPSRFWPFVTSGIFSWRGKARMALDMLLPRRDAGGGGDGGEEDESLAQFVRRRLGREALERMAQPMVGGIYTADPERLSLRATMPRFLEMEREHRSLIRGMWRARRKLDASRQAGTSGARYGLFLSFDEGMQALTDKLSERLPPRSIRLNSRIETLSHDRATGFWRLSLTTGDAIECDAVCLALPAYAAAGLLSATDSQLASELETIQYASTATVNLAYRRADVPHPLDGFGFVAPIVERHRTLACT